MAANLAGLKRLLHWGPLLTLFIVTYIYIIFLLDIIGSGTPITGSDFGDYFLFSLLEFRVLSCFLLSVFQEPGYVSLGWDKSKKAQEALPHLRLCKVCEMKQPPRTHHCRKCGRCIKKMDHHCPWINNCVGHDNERTFFLFVTSASIVCTFVCVVIFYKMWMDHSVNFVCLIRCIFPLRKNRYSKEQYLLCSCGPCLRMVLAFILSLCTAIGTGWLASGIIHSVKINTTLLEEWLLGDYKRVNKLKHLKSPYNLGAFENWKQFIGNCPMRWVFLPVFGHENDGLFYPVREGVEKYMLEDIRREMEEYRKERMLGNIGGKKSRKNDKETKKGKEKKEEGKKGDTTLEEEKKKEF